MRKLILHIGMNKTGTTALQHHLSRNFRLLRSNNVIYQGWSGPDQSHNYVADLLHKGDLSTISRIFKGMAVSGATTIISSGRLFAWTANQAKRKHDLYMLDELEDRETKAVHDICEVASRYFDDVTILAYLRRQDDALESFYNQSVKNGTWSGGDIHDIYRFLYPALDYRQILTRWAGVLDDSHIHARVYDRASLVSGDIVQDFLHACGFEELPEIERISSSACTENVRLPRDLFEFVRILNRVPLEKGERRQYKIAIQKVATELPRDRDMHVRLLSSMERDRLMDLYDADNREVRQRFVDGVHAELFSPVEIEGLDETSKYQGLTTEKMLEIHYRIQRRMRNKQKNVLLSTIEKLRGKAHTAMAKLMMWLG